MSRERFMTTRGCATVCLINSHRASICATAGSSLVAAPQRHACTPRAVRYLESWPAEIVTLRAKVQDYTVGPLILKHLLHQCSSDRAERLGRRLGYGRTASDSENLVCRHMLQSYGTSDQGQLRR